MATNRRSAILNLFNKYRDIFDHGTLAQLPNLIKKELDEIYLPHSSLTSIEDGLPLKDNVGFITIQETYKDKTIGYVYRFSSTEYDCLYSNKKTKDIHCEHFSFHFDLDEAHSAHVSSIFRSLRYMTTTISLEQFLDFVRDTFFEMKDGSLKRRDGLLWANHL